MSHPEYLMKTKKVPDKGFETASKYAELIYTLYSETENK